MTAAIHKGVIPAAGRGTRMQPFSLAVPKELAPIGSTPALHLVIDEAVEAGLTSIAIVSNSGSKSLLRDYVDSQQRSGLWKGTGFTWVEQPQPDGLGDAIARCRDFAAGEPFGLLLPDNLPLGEGYSFDLLIKAADGGRHALAVLELDHSDSNLYGDCGRIDFERLDDGSLLLQRIHDKQPGKLQIAPGEVVFRTCGRYVCQPDLFEEMDRVRPTIVGEFDEVPVYQALAQRGRVLGVPIPMPLFDVGHARGMLAASAWSFSRLDRD